MHKEKLVGWVHIFFSMEDLNNFITYISASTRDIKIYVQFYAVIFRPLSFKNGMIINPNGNELFAVLTESFSYEDIEKLVNKGLTDFKRTFPLEELDEIELEIDTSSLTARIRDSQYFKYYSKFIDYLKEKDLF